MLLSSGQVKAGAVGVGLLGVSPVVELPSVGEPPSDGDAPVVLAGGAAATVVVVVVSMLGAAV